MKSRDAIRSSGPIACTLAVAVILSGCQDQGPGPRPTPSATVRPSSSATLTIVQPQPNQVVATTTMDVQFKLTGGRIIGPSSTHITPDTGHIHLSIDGRLISMNYQLEQPVSLAGFVAGPHLLQGEFVAADHAPFNPRVIQKLLFDYEPSGSG